MRLSVLNFFSPADEALELAVLCDGHECFDRFWVGEHHTQEQIPDALTFALMAAGVTKRIRIGTGAVSLMHRSPLLIAETAIMGELFFPGRIDLGVTKAQAEGPAAELLADRFDQLKLMGDYDRRLTQLRNLLGREKDLPDLFMAGTVERGPPMFVMGTSEARARMTGELGVGFVASFHHGGTVASVAAMMDSYKQSFRPSAFFERPHGIIAVSGYIAEEPAKIQAARIAEEKLKHTMGGFFNRSISVYGGPKESCRELRKLAAAVHANEAMFLCIHGWCEDCYLALAEGWTATA